MIIKSLSRKRPSFEQLINYMEKDDGERAIYHNFYGSDSLSREEIIKEFMLNSKNLPKRKNGNYLYHEIISFEAKHTLPKNRIKEILIDVGELYLKERAEKQLAFSNIHQDTNHIHMHFCISANEVDGFKRIRLNKTEFANVQKNLELYVIEKYPELNQSIIYNKSLDKEKVKTTNKEQEEKRRTGKTSKKEQIKNMFHGMFEQANTKEELIKLLDSSGFTLREDRGKTPAILNNETGRVYRLKTLGLVPHYEALKMRLTSEQEQKKGPSKKEELRDIFKNKQENKERGQRKTRKMNAQTAKSLNLVDVLGRLGFAPNKIQGYSAWYKSPFRDERTPSFKIDIGKNLWYDFGTGEGGTIIDFFIRLYHEPSISHVLKLIDDVDFLTAPIPAYSLPKAPRQKTDETIIQSVREITNPGLVHYIEKNRGIDINLVRNYASEIHYSRGSSSYVAIGHANQNGGFEIRDSKFKGTIKNKDITHFTGESKSSKIAVFEGLFDFLSLLSLHKKKTSSQDVLVMNSVSQVNRASEFIEKGGFDEINLYLDNDRAGQEAVDKFKERFEFVHDHSGGYLQHKDLNDYLLYKQSLDISLEDEMKKRFSPGRDLERSKFLALD